tara:strand:- start:138 stop:500 length:363 start_codon:yes stop_codon:yes gene_type:complete
MVGKCEDKASQKEIQDFRDALEKMNLSIRRFGEVVASHEAEETYDAVMEDDEKNKICEKVKKSFNKNRSITVVRLNQYWKYLSQEPNFCNAGRIVLPNGRDYLGQSKYTDQIMAAFSKPK